MKVDIIMPCYYSNEVIIPGLDKIAQQTIIKDITLIMVNDCSPNTNCKYQDLIALYKNKINIRYFETEKNSGPGIARQIGIDNATADWVMFQDDDDELYANDSVETLLSLSYTFNNVCVTGQINFNNIELWPPIPFSVQGSIFNRKILKDRDIHFEPLLSFKEEDGLFSVLFDLKTRDLPHKSISIPVYNRKKLNNHISLTQRVNMIDSYLAMIHLKAIPLQYVMQLNIYNHIDDIVNEAILIIPNFLNNLILYLKQYNKTISFQQFQDLKVSVMNYIIFLSILDIKNLKIDIDYMMKWQHTLYQDNGFGNFSFEIIKTFESEYWKYLKILEENYVK